MAPSSARVSRRPQKKNATMIDINNTSHRGLDELAERSDAAQGQAVLRKVYDFLGRFVSYPCEYSRTAHALWIVHSHLMDIWESTPRIAFLSAEPSSGKTRALEVTELLVPRPVAAVNVSPAYLFRKIGAEEGVPTILYDEIDTVFGPKAKENEEIRALLNAGHRKGAVAGRCVVHGKTVKTEEIPAYSAVALAGIGWLPDTILSRSVIIRMRRRKVGERIEPFRRRIHEAADVWESLIAIADAAGGEWPGLARKAAVALVAVSKEAEASLGVLLLIHVKAVFGDAEQLSTDVLLHRLQEIDEAPWSDLKGKPLNDRGLASRLRQYGIRPQTIRIDGETTRRGYRRQDFLDVWSRYVDTPPPSSATSETSETSDTTQCFRRETVSDAVSDVSDAGPTTSQKNSRKISPVLDVSLVSDLPEHRGEGRRLCVQCHGDEGAPPTIHRGVGYPPEGVWLHKQCERFWLKEHPAAPNGDRADDRWADYPDFPPSLRRAARG
jgi:uncharacterized protein DUF3631